MYCKLFTASDGGCGLSALRSHLAVGFMSLIRTIAIASFLWGSAAPSASSMTSEPAVNDTTNLSGKEWEATFFYYAPPPATADDSHESEREPDTSGAPSFHELNTALRRYQDLADGMIRQMSIAHEMALRTEALLFPHHTHTGIKSPQTFLSSKLEEKITKSASLLEQNIFVLEQLMKPFPVTVGQTPLLTSYPGATSHFTFPPCNQKLDQHPTEKESNLPIQSIGRYISPFGTSQSNTNEYEGEEEPYDTATHIITHLTRDWTAEGALIRKETHNWIVNQIWSYHNMQIEALDSVCSHQSPLSPVLVPGAGTARLAFDIAFAHSESNDETKSKSYPFDVEAIDNSVVMATAAYHLLRHFSNNCGDGMHNSSLKIYPFVSDPFVNEVDTQRRWESAVCPEGDAIAAFRQIHKQQSSHQPSLSYAIGDFVETYASLSKHGMYGSIATCFFIDTATNIYEYVLTIRNLLRVGGYWINLGPLHWHRNAQLQPSTDELKDVIILAGLKIIHWEISEMPIAYRHQDDIRKGTRAESYLPLKFVVALQPDEYGHDREQHNDDAPSNDLLSSIEKLRLQTGRRSVVNNTIIDDDQEY